MPESRQPTHDAVDQPSLFFPAVAQQAAPLEDSFVRLAPLTPASTLGACALPYAEHLRLTDHSAYTITCFLSDLRLLTEYLGRERT
ncbi:MAG: hypothetical protein ACRDHP_00880, partial [Ktedonobacterales bacterium]